MSHVPKIVLIDRAKESTATVGQGTVALGGALFGFVRLSGVGDGNFSYYTLEESSNFEVGIGTYDLAGNTFTRDEVYFSSEPENAKINLGGNATIFITYPADRAIVANSGGYD